MPRGDADICRLDDAIEACRTTAEDMHVHYKETSLAGLAVSQHHVPEVWLILTGQTTVKIPLCEDEA